MIRSSHFRVVYPRNLVLTAVMSIFAASKFIIECMRTLVLLVLFVATLPGALGQTTIHTQSTSKELLLQDYDYFFSQLEQIHPDPYSAFGGKDEFTRQLNS